MVRRGHVGRVGRWGGHHLVAGSDPTPAAHGVPHLLAAAVRGHPQIGRGSDRAHAHAAASGREPDLLFVSHVHADRIRHTWIEGPADLVIEIVSPESEERDWEVKRAEYASAGIPEYWVLDYGPHDAAFFQLGADGQYVRAPLDETGTYHSKVLPGFWLRVEWLWRTPLPDLEAAEALCLLRR